MTMDFFDNALLVLFAGIAVYIVYRYFAWTTREKPDYDVMPSYGSIGEWDVLAEDGKVVLGIIPRRGQFEYEREYFTLSPEDARQLAAWMRVAAAPGKTLAMAQQAVASKK